jgi:stringent starvation protein B
MTDQLSSTRPYLLRAMHEWLSDNGQTPFIVVDASLPGVDVPEGHIKDGRIVLNIDWAATRNLQMENDFLSFEARFGGVAHSVLVPIAAVQGIYARESGQGMLFQDEPAVSQASGEATPEQESGPVQAIVQPVQSVTNSGDPDDDGGNNNPRPTRPGGPGLRLVK